MRGARQAPAKVAKSLSRCFPASAALGAGYLDLPHHHPPRALPGRHPTPTALRAAQTWTVSVSVPDSAFHLRACSHLQALVATALGPRARPSLHRPITSMHQAAGLPAQARHSAASSAPPRVLCRRFQSLCPPWAACRVVVRFHQPRIRQP